MNEFDPKSIADVLAKALEETSGNITLKLPPGGFFAAFYLWGSDVLTARDGRKIRLVQLPNDAPPDAGYLEVDS